jgi:hypothetical protein
MPERIDHDKLSPGHARTQVVENLGNTLGTPHGMLSTQTLTVDDRTTVEVQRLESAPGEAATLDAVWTVSRDADGRTRTGRTTTRETAPDKSYDALTAAHSRAVARLSRDIADVFGALDQTPPTLPGDRRR